jgi:glyoxylate/hydroxypyruvate reductase A
MILLVNSGGPAAIDEWRRHFAVADPALRVHFLDDPAVAPEKVAYAFVWSPPPGRLAQFPNLRLVLSSGAGVDHITRDPDWPRHLGIVRMGGEEPAQRMGEYVALACLSLLRDARRMALNQQAGTWDSFETERTAPDTRVGIMGLGNLGARAAEMLLGLGFQVAGWSRSPKAIEGVQSHVGEAGREAFLANTDILVNLLPDTPATRGILDATAFALLPQGACVVNAGRGPQVVLPDLMAALDTGHLAGAMLDVFETEPLPADHPVWRHPKVIVSSHLASMASRPARARYVAEAIALHEAGERPPNLFDPARGY